jgi:uncharacterized protein YraI
MAAAVEEVVAVAVPATSIGTLGPIAAATAPMASSSRAAVVAADCGAVVRRGRQRFGIGLLALVLLLAASPGVALESEDQVGYARTRLNLRACPSTAHEIRSRIPRGGRFEVASCEDGWCLGSYRGHQGFVSERYLTPDLPSMSLARRHSGARGYTNSRGIWVPSPSYSSSGPPPGASALCCDGTCSYSMSRRGTCSHHGGGSRWL